MSIKIKDRVLSFHKKTSGWFFAHPSVMAVVLAVSIAFINEILSRRSLVSAFVFVFTHPMFFLANAALIFVFEALSLFFKKRAYMMWLFAVIFFALGVTNFVVRSFRQTPFSSMDFTLVKSVFPILKVYLSWLGIILILFLIIGVIVFLVWLWIKADKFPIRLKGAFITFGASMAASVVIIGGNYLSGGFSKHFSNLADAYRDYGFTFCFCAGIVDRGIDKPDDYDDEIQGIVSELLFDTDINGTDGNEDNISEEYPNIIFVQLESFCDLNLLKGFEFSSNPNPIFSSLKDRCSYGTLTVPSIGAGTANTEFEVLSGMSLKWFGAGEYPYETVLQKNTCETVCYNLSERGYTSHAVHNYKGNFYDRSKVFKNLGFNTFTPIEHMNGIVENALGWADDSVLTEYVTASLASTAGPDLVYCISVQPHGKYPADQIDDGGSIIVESCPDNINVDGFTYSANQLYETDMFIGELIAALEKIGEPTVAVFFGDHLPNIGLTEAEIPEDMTLYDTEYVIWQSEGTDEIKHEPLYSYQLSAEILSVAGFNNGVLTKLHQNYKSNEHYLEYLEMIEYDILYGERFVYGGENPFEPTDLKLGIKDITISEIFVGDNNSYIFGENFTEASKISVNGIIRQTEFVDDGSLTAVGVTLDENDKIKIIQVSDGIFQVGETSEYDVELLLK